MSVLGILVRIAEHVYLHQSLETTHVSVSLDTKETTAKTVSCLVTNKKFIVISN